MGCDIHLGVEAKRDGRWVNVPYVPMEKCWCCSGSGSDKQTPSAACWRCTGKGYCLYDARSYDTFAILADVRNGRELAGVATGDGFEPISEPRGLPDDMDPATKEFLSDEHSQSWLTLQELLDFDWEQTTFRRGYVGPNQFRTFLEKGSPDSWSRGVGGSSVRVVTNEEMQAKIAADPTLVGGKDLLGRHGADGNAYYTMVEWKVSYKQAASIFYTESIPALQRLAAEVGGPENVRIVFDFDS
jgi:hypothetical protein